MPEPTEREKEVMTDAIDGIALALLRSGELDGDSLKHLTETKVEKFVYYGMKKMGDLHDVTYSWYLAGAKSDDPTDLVGTGPVKTAYDRISSPAQPSSGFVDDSTEGDISEEVERYADYYLNDLDIESLCFTRGGEMLLEFYESEAPLEYRELYVACQKLRNEISRLKAKIWKSIQNRSEGPTLAEFGQGSRVTGPDHYISIANLISELHLELSKEVELQRVLPEVRRFTDLLEDACLALSALEVERIDESHMQFFNRINQFFYHHAWKLPALIISAQTAVGPRREDLKTRHLLELEKNRGTFSRKFEKLERTAADAALKPTERDFPSSNSEDEVVDGFLEAYLNEEDAALE